MKKYFLIFFFSVSALFMLLPGSILEAKPIVIKVRISVSKHCEGGFGFCATAYFTPGKGRDVEAECSIEENVLHVRILKEYTSPELAEELLGRNFQVEERQRLPAFMLEQLNEEKQIELLPGNYRIIEEDNAFYVRLNIEY